MKLFYRKIGEGKPLIILHGLFGQSDNWNTLGKKFAEHQFEVYLVDLRNHGNSPHSNIWNYQVMSDDIHELITELGLKNVTLLGHSMGGKVVMKLAIQHPELIDKIIVSDIAPKFHKPDNEDVINALRSINLKTFNTRKEAEKELAHYIHQPGIIQFLLKNIYWEDDNDKGSLTWKFNKTDIINQIKNISEAIESDRPCTINTLFIRGEKSNYIFDEDIEHIHDLFPNCTLKTIPNAGHWVHADNPLIFFETVINFIQ
jgi:esterase